MMRKKSKDRIVIDGQSDRKKFSIIFLIISFVLFVALIFLYFKLVKINRENLDFESKISNLLLGKTVSEKEEYRDSLNNIYVQNASFIEEYNSDIEKLNIGIDDFESKNSDLKKIIDEKEKKIDLKKQEYQSLKRKYTEISTHIVSDIITFNQYPKYPNGCEAVSLYIMLKHYGVDVSVDSVIDALPRGNAPHYVNGILYGGDPNYEFLGDPRSDDGWGIYDKGLVPVANKFKSGIINGTGMDFNQIFGLINENRPILVWTSMDMKKPFVSTKWISEKTGDEIVWKRYNHAVLVIGYNDDSIIVSDPINGRIRYFDRNEFISIYNFMGRKALYY